MSATKPIPFVDLVTPHEQLKDELCAVFERALKTAGFIGGPMVDEFEREFASFCESEHCVAAGSGTDALRFALIAAGVKQGDVVLTVPNTFIATTEAISQAGARPAFVDIDERTYNMDAEKLHQYLEMECAMDDSGHAIDMSTERRVTAVVPVHLYGQTCDMDPILELAERHNLVVVEDACQAHGAEYFSRKQNRWRKAGSMGRAAAFSFYPGKNLGACGEAGAVTTSDPELAQKIRMLRDHGQSKKYYHDMEGYNGRLDALQAGILQVKLRHLAEWNEQRRKCANRYDALFASTTDDVRAPFEPKWAKSAYHLYVVRVTSRASIQRHLTELGIGTGIHYPVPLHLQGAYNGLGYKAGAFPIAEEIADEILSLPIFPGLTHNQQRLVVASLLTSIESNRNALAVSQST